MRSPDAPPPPSSSAPPTSVQNDVSVSKANDTNDWTNAEFNLDSMFSAAEASDMGDNDDGEEGSLNVG